MIKIRLKNKRSTHARTQVSYGLISSKRSTRARTQVSYGLISSKRSAIGSTLAWIVATFVIFLIMVLYFIFAGVTYENKGKSESTISIIYENSEVSATRTLIGFLESDAGNGVKISSLAFSSDIKDVTEKDRQKIFEDKANAFLKNTYPGDESTLILIGANGNQIYQASNNYLSVASQDIPESFSSSINIDFPLPYGKKINLVVNIR